jgi:hypothetical protein
MKQFKTFRDFYPFYLSEHSHPICRLLHFVGTLLIVIVLITTFITGKWVLLVSLPLLGYGFAWFGHFFFEKNKPATFTYPLYSLMGDWVMFKDILLRKISIF